MERIIRMPETPDVSIDILAFSPHPDDAELGCGGSLLLSRGKGLRIAIADLTEGECASRGTPEQRKEEKSRASSVLGLINRFSVGLPDTKIGLEPSHQDTVIELIRAVRPRIVLAPYGKDRHPDHERAGQLVRAACFYAGVAGIGKGAPYGPEEVYYYMVHSPFEPSFVVDITPVWDEKCEALNAYRTQFSREDPDMRPTAISNPEFLRYHEARSVYFGAMIGVTYGEPFFCRGPLAASGLPGVKGGRPDKAGLPVYRSM
ncbi:MAG: bacillithiol biosynthesis deacetylase BshB1 [Deltaproteobacteria bacterium]|nr:bacillithiol biosynthesis deacetylase BshB1 [Deltaproteobacteria bacterium]